jgi:hypothetical protein
MSYYNEMNLHSLFKYTPYVLYTLMYIYVYIYLIYSRDALLCFHVYVWKWMDSLGVSGDAFLKSWRIGLLAGARKHNSII